MNKAYSYIRFSSSKQSDGDSLRRQTALTDAYIQRHNLILDDTLNLHDLGVSGFTGANAKTGALSRFLTAIQDGKVESGSVLIVENLDRLSREQLLDALHVFRQIVRAGVKVVTLKPEREYTQDNIGDDFVILEAVFDMMRAHRESKRKSDLGRSAWNGKRNRIKDEILTSRVPAWIRVVDGKFDVIPERAEIVRQIFAWVTEGFGVRVVTRKLNEQGVFIGRVERWNSGFVAKILKNRAVFGEFQPHTGRDGHSKPIGEPIANYFPAILKETEFYAARAALASRFNQRGPMGKEVTNLFTGLLYDAKDKSPLNLVHKDKVRLYSAATIRGEVNASKIGFPYEPFERAVMGFLSELRPADIGPVLDDTMVLQGRLGELDSKIEKVNQAIVDNADITSLIATLAMLEAERRDVAAELERAKAKLQNRPNLDDIRKVISMLGDHHSVLDTGGDKVELRTRLKARIRQIVDSIITLFIDMQKERWAMIQINMTNGSSRQIAVRAKDGWAVGMQTAMPMMPTIDMRDEGTVAMYLERFSQPVQAG